jgi:hypothetical protein
VFRSAVQILPYVYKTIIAERICSAHFFCA